MKKLHLPLIEALPEKLCYPERFKPVAEVALSQLVQLELPIPPNIELGAE